MKTPIKTLLLLLALVIPRPAVRAADQEIKIYPGFNYIGAHVVSAPTTTPVLLSGFNQFVLQFKSTPAWAWTHLNLAASAYTVEDPVNGYWDIVVGCNTPARTLTLNHPWLGTLGMTPILRRVKTLNQLFGTQPKAGLPGTADRIWVPDGTGNGYNFYFRNAAGAWRKTGAPGIYQGTAPIYFIQGMFYERNDTANFILKFTGQPITTQKMVFMGDVTSHRSMLTSLGANSSGAGTDLVSSLFGLTTPYVPAKTLGTFGLFPIVAGADVFTLQHASGNLETYAFNGTNWEDWSTNNADTVPLSSGFVYDRWSGAGVGVLTP